MLIDFLKQQKTFSFLTYPVLQNEELYSVRLCKVFLYHPVSCHWCTSDTIISLFSSLPMSVFPAKIARLFFLYKMLINLGIRIW